MADIVATTTIDFAELIGLPVPSSCEALAAWRERTHARPSVAMPAAAQGRYLASGSPAQPGSRPASTDA